ncbi:MAG: hypothetical protein IT304_08155 [Dehalococcoidia bacterium]|nr:hypothetical protein [Dehalococcoidia bacterium]
MSSPEPPVPPATPTPPQRGQTGDENAVVVWARAIALGIRDTARDVVEEGRKGARRAYEEGWRDYERKTKGRRRQH